MSSPTPESVKEEVRLGGVEYAKVLAGTNGFTKVKISGLPTTASTFLDIAGTSMLSAGGGSMQQNLVAAAGATTFTTTGYVRVTVTDSANHIVAGDHYIRIGTLT